MMNRIRLLTAACALTTLVGLASLQSAHAQGGKTATLKGKVVYDGDPPARASLAPKFGAVPKDAPHCAKGGPDDTEDPTWIVDKNTKGVEFAVVFLKFASPPKYNFADTGLGKEVVIDQPFCAFKPHVSVVDVKDQKLMVKNSAPMLHNTRMAGNPIKNPARNENVSPKQEKVFPVKSDNQPIKVNCDVHKWMEGYVWAFDHPFAAVTKADGTFEIKGIPPGPVSVVVWHEPDIYSPSKDGKKIDLKEGENTLPEVKIKK
jgi:hypothetical protein